VAKILLKKLIFYLKKQAGFWYNIDEVGGGPGIGAAENRKSQEKLSKSNLGLSSFILRISE